MMTKKHVAQQESGYGEERRKGCMPTLFRSYWLRIQYTRTYREMMRMSCESFKKILGLQFRVSERVISYIIDEVTKAIVQYIGID